MAFRCIYLTFMSSTPLLQQAPLWLRVVRLLRWNKPAGRLILMMPALWAVFLAGRGTPPFPLVGIIILGSLATSAAGCVANDFWDRDIDPQVERTKNRPLADRSLSIATGILVGIVALACAAGLALYLNLFSFGLCVAAVPFIVFYPLAKRVFPVPQLVLSVTWGFAVLIGWSAAVGRLEVATGWLWGAVVLWTLGFDTIYALSDREDDRRLGIHSSAIFFSDRTPEAIAVFFAGAAVCLGIAGFEMALHLGFWIALAIAIALWIRQYLTLRQPELPAVTFGKMFAQNVVIGAIVLAGEIAGSLLY